MSSDSFVNKVNSLASSKTPFFFLIDFEKKEPLVFSLEEAFENRYYSMLVDIVIMFSPQLAKTRIV